MKKTMKRYAVVSLAAVGFQMLSLPVQAEPILSPTLLQSDSFEQFSSEKSLWHQIFGRAESEDMFVSEDSLDRELKGAIEKKLEELKAEQIPQVEKAKAEIPLSVRAVPQALERREKTIELESHRQVQKQMKEFENGLRDDVHQVLQYRDAVGHNHGAGARRVMVGTLSVAAGTALTAAPLAFGPSDPIGSDSEKLMQFVRKDQRVLEAEANFSALRNRLSRRDNSGASALTHIKQKVATLTEKLKAFERRPSDFVSPIFIERYQQAEHALVEAITRNESPVTLSLARKRRDEAYRLLTGAENVVHKELLNELAKASSYRKEIDTAKLELVRARQSAIFKAQKLYPWARRAAKATAVVGGALLISSAVGLVYPWFAEDHHPKLDKRLSLSLLKTEPRPEKPLAWDYPSGSKL